MLKKAGILVAATTAGLLAVSPLAFAGDKGHDGGGRDGDRETSITNEENTNIDIDEENNVDIDDSSVNNCDNEQDSNDESRNGGGLLLGAVSVLNSSNVNALQCTNILNNFLNENDILNDNTVDVL